MKESDNRESFSHGFTLLEVVISLLLMVVVLSAVYGTFFTVHRVTERFNDLPVKYHETRTTLDIMRREIESSFIKIPETEESPEHEALFVIKDRDILGSNSSELNLTAFSIGGRGIGVISYFVEEDDEKLRLLKQQGSVIDPDSGYTVEMIEDIGSFTVETFYNGKWVKTWDSSETGRLPDIVKLRIEFDDNGKTISLTEYAKPRTGSVL